METAAEKKTISWIRSTFSRCSGALACHIIFVNTHLPRCHENILRKMDTSAEEDHVIQSKALEQLLNGPCNGIILANNLFLSLYINRVPSRPVDLVSNVALFIFSICCHQPYVGPFQTDIHPVQILCLTLYFYFSSNHQMFSIIIHNNWHILNTIMMFISVVAES